MSPFRGEVVPVICPQGDCRDQCNRTCSGVNSSPAKTIIFRVPAENGIMSTNGIMLVRS